MTKPSILVVGSLNMDLMVYGVPRVAALGESLFCEGNDSLCGGKGANQAVAAARLGADTTMVGMVGDDNYGRELTRGLAQFGVDTSGVFASGEVQTGTATIVVDKETGGYIMYLVPGANNCVSPKQVEQALMKKRYDMVLMQLEMPLETVYQTYELAAKRGIPVFLDAGPAKEISHERLKGIFVISPNENETKALVGIDPGNTDEAIRAAKLLYEKVAPQYVLLKLGERGALLYDGKTAELIPCFADVNAVDTTAAGDTFGAAFAMRYCMGANVRDAIMYAHAAAGICVSRKGAQISMPDAAEVDAFLQRRTTHV